MLTNQLQLPAELVRRGHLGHLDVVAESLLGAVEGRRHRKDRVTPLDGPNASGREAPAVADAVHEVDDRDRQVPGQHEVPVEGVRASVLLDGAARRDQRLGEHLTAEDPVGTDVAVPSAEDVALERFERE